jgi:hypothetical protein
MKSPLSFRVSKQALTRCHHCSRHHQVDRSLSRAELLALRCDFCGEQLLSASAVDPLERPVSRLLTSRSSRLAAGLLGASALLSACDNEDPVTGGNSAGETSAGETSAGETSAGETSAGETPAGELAGDLMPMPLYGAVPSGELAGEEVGGEPPLPPYGSFPSGDDYAAGEETAGDPGDQPAYGAFPAGDEG